MQVKDVCFNAEVFPQRELVALRLARTTLAVPEEAPAVEVLRALRLLGFKVAVALDEENRVSGVFLPQVWLERVASGKIVEESDLSQLLSGFPDPLFIANMLAERPPEYRCERGGHLTYFDPCPEHG